MLQLQHVHNKYHGKGLDMVLYLRRTRELGVRTRCRLNERCSFHPGEVGHIAHQHATLHQSVAFSGRGDAEKAPGSVDGEWLGSRAIRCGDAEKGLVTRR